MRQMAATLVKGRMRLGSRFLSFAKAATPELPPGRLLRLSLLQVPVGAFIVWLGCNAEPAYVAGFGAGLLAAGTLTAAMAIAKDGGSGLALGTWGAVQATATGGGIALAGGLRDAVSSTATYGMFGSTLTSPSTGYSVIYQIEIALLFATLIAIGPLVRSARASFPQSSSKFGLAEFPS